MTNGIPSTLLLAETITPRLPQQCVSTFLFPFPTATQQHSKSTSDLPTSQKLTAPERLILVPLQLLPFALPSAKARAIQNT